MNQINLYHKDLQQVFGVVRNQVPNYTYDYQKHVILLKDEHHEVMGYIRLPLHLLLGDNLSAMHDDGCILYLSIESGSAAICVMQGKENVYHTTFSAYMNRGKQGFSQIKYLKKKGKSKAGSRIRLAATTIFFENINSTLIDLMEEFEVDRIGLSCSATLIPFLFQSKVACPFDKKSTKLYKIPLHIPHSNYSNLDAAIKKLWAPILFYDEKYEAPINSLFNNQL
ncbi:MAG: hypothetical protein ACFHWX_09445 [Bacteroidota bacterium]